jgi:hypothetical protein
MERKNLLDRNNTKGAWLFLLAIILFMTAYYFFYYRVERNRLIKRGRYTIGVVKKIIFGKDVNDPYFVYTVRAIHMHHLKQEWFKECIILKPKM